MKKADQQKLLYYASITILRHHGLFTSQWRDYQIGNTPSEQNLIDLAVVHFVKKGIVELHPTIWRWVRVREDV